MNIQFATYHWAFGTPGGGERQLHYFFEALKRGRRGWKDLHPHLFDAWKPDFTPGNIFHYFAALPSSVDFLNYLKSDKQCRLVLSPNFWPDPQKWEETGVLESMRTILWLSDLIIVNSYIEEEALVRLMKIDSSRIAVVYNGVDDAFFKHVHPSIFRDAFGVSGKYILNVANVEPRKNQLAFLEAIQAFPDLKLVTIGGRREGWYFNACKQFGGEAFIHIPAIDHSADMLRSALAGCEFFAMPSLVETPSIASLEAAAAGVRVLTTELGSTREYFGDNVTYVNPFDIESMRGAIARVLSSEPSSVLTDRIREQFTARPIAESLVRAYSRVAGRSFFD